MTSKEVKEMIREAANAGFAVGIDTSAFKNMCAEVAREESARRTQETAAALYGQPLVPEETYWEHEMIEPQEVDV